MPHIIVKLAPGKTAQQKARLASALTADVVRVLNYGEDAVSVAIEEIDPREWAEKVYQPDILHRPDNIYKRPGYTM
jgi:4-oxalocrotonate tautomerase